MMYVKLLTEHFPQCALERKIPIVSPEWITENYQIWLKGDDVDLEKVRVRISAFQRVAQ